MSQTAHRRPTEPRQSGLLPDWPPLCEQALGAAESYATLAKAAVSRLVLSDGAIDAAKLDREQRAAHGYAWLATYVTALRETLDWARRLEAGGKLGEIEALICQALFGEYLAQITGGIAMSQGEIVRPADLGLDDEPHAFASDTAVRTLTRNGANSAVLMRIATLIADCAFGNSGLEDEALLMVREQFRRFAEEHRDAAHEWHKQDAFIPLAVIEELAELGVFGLTVPEEYGGAGLGKLAMCIVTEELSRGYLGLGSLGTRSEIAAELIRLGGTDAQKKKWLPKLASGEILPTAVFTEPNTGSDLGSLRTRAVRDGETYRITGNKTWITHASRADVMTLLARTDANEPGYKGLSMFLAEKPRGTNSDPFPIAGLKGGEIRVLGYRGMKEYELAFDGFEVKAENLLGGVEGQGFKQLMATFEISARADGGAGRRRGAERARARPRLRQGPHPVRQADRRIPARRRQARLDGGRDNGGAPAHLVRGAPEGQRQALRHRGRHGQAARGTRRLGQRR